MLIKAWTDRLQLHLQFPAQGDWDSQEVAGHLSVKDHCKFAQVLAYRKGKFEGPRCLLPPTPWAAPVIKYTWKVFALSCSWEPQLSYGKLNSMLLYITIPSCTQWQLRSRFIAFLYDTHIRQLQTFQFNELIYLYYSPKPSLLTTVWDKTQLRKLSNPVWQLLRSDLMKSCSEILHQICMKMEQ